MHGQGNVALLLRESTYHFHGEHGVIRPGIDKIRDAYESFSDPEVGAERRDILRQRIIKTLADQNILKNITVNGCKRDGFIPGSGVDQILSKMVEGFQGKELIEGNIDDAFLNAFIEKLKLGSSPVPVSYVNHRVAYCRPDDIAGLIAD